jgi:hypothetical protein
MRCGDASPILERQDRYPHGRRRTDAAFAWRAGQTRGRRVGVRLNMRLKDRQGCGVDGDPSGSVGDLADGVSGTHAPAGSQKERKFMKYARAVENRDANEPAVSDDWGRRLWPFDVEALYAKARRTTGLEDFGAPPIERALSVLAGSLEREATLHRVGRFLMRMHLLDLLKTRLRLVDAWKRQPQEDVESSPIARPIFITGMPRSGRRFFTNCWRLTPP